MCELHLPVSRQGHLMRRFAFVESAVRWYIALPVNISCTPHHNCVFCSFVFLTDSFCIWKLKSSRVPFSLMYFQKWLTTLSEYVCVRLAGCAPSNNFRCRMGVNHWRKCSKHIQQNLSKCLVPCKYSVFFHWKETGLVYFCACSRGRWGELWNKLTNVDKLLSLVACRCQSEVTGTVDDLYAEFFIVVGLDSLFTSLHIVVEMMLLWVLH